MRVTALVLGVLGGVVGLTCGSLAVQTGAGLQEISRVLGTSASERLSGAQQLVGLGRLAVLVSLLGIVAGGLALGRPRTAGALMLIAALTGVLLIRSDYLIAGGLLLAGAVLSLLAPRPPQLAPAPAAPAALGAPAASDGHAGTQVIEPTAPPVGETPSSTGARSIAVAAWGIAAVLLVATWWFWVFALFGVLVIAAIAWVPRVGTVVLAWTGWVRLPMVGTIRGWKATAALLLLSVLVLVVGVSVAPRPPTP